MLYFCCQRERTGTDLRSSQWDWSGRTSLCGWTIIWGMCFESSRSKWGCVLGSVWERGNNAAALSVSKPGSGQNMRLNQTDHWDGRHQGETGDSSFPEVKRKKRRKNYFCIESIDRVWIHLWWFFTSLTFLVAPAGTACVIPPWAEQRRRLPSDFPGMSWKSRSLAWGASKENIISFSAAVAAFVIYRISSEMANFELW